MLYKQSAGVGCSVEEGITLIRAIRSFFEAAFEIGPEGQVNFLVDRREILIDKRERFCVSKSTKLLKQADSGKSDWFC